MQPCCRNSKIYGIYKDHPHNPNTEVIFYRSPMPGCLESLHTRATGDGGRNRTTVRYPCEGTRSKQRLHRRRHMTPQIDGSKRRHRKRRGDVGRRRNGGSSSVMSKMISGGGTAAVLAAATAWSVPYRACQAIRLVHSPTPHHYRASRILGMTAFNGYPQQRHSTVGFASYASSFGSSRISGVASSRSLTGGSVGTKSGHPAVSGSQGNVDGVASGRPRAAGVCRMTSDEEQFFISPDDPPPSEDGIGPPGPVVGGGDGGDKIVSVGLESEIQNSFMQYAMSIILGRALPDVRDGLKPVHRRILYAMYGLGLTPEGTHRKCARVVGEVLGKYHPHGDTAVYDALVRMAQDFVMSAPLIDGHGNFGSIDNDPAAAMRYTECKLSPIARDSLLTDINLDTVKMMTNFDGNEREPVVLPSRLPLLLINGATGIAVGMATNVPPHNMGEIVDATVGLIENPDISDDQLFRLVPGPDFPTGGCIMGLAGARKLYTTSNGGVTIRATTHMELIEAKGRPKRNAIVVTEIPYQVNKSALLQKIADMVNDKKLDGISDLRDESDREGVRIVVELKRDANPQVVENNLFKKTQLQTSFSGNMLALGSDGTKPHRFSLRNALQSFIDFRFTTVRRRAAHELGKVRAREHIVQGMLKALGMIDGVIEVVRGSKDTPQAREGLMAEPFDLSQDQADAILGLRLGRLTSMEEGKLKTEAEELNADMARLDGLMTQDKRVFDLIVEEMTKLKNKHGVPRRTLIKPDEGELSEEDLLANDGSVVVMTDAGYIKRMPLEDFTAQSRGTRGKMGAKLSSDDDVVQHFFTCQDHDTILFVSSRGVAYSIRAFQVPVASRTAKGVPVPQVLPMSGDEEITSVLAVDEFKENEYLVLLTQQGYVKRTALAAFRHTTSRGLVIVTLGQDDKLQWVKRCRDDDSILIGTKQGYATRFLANIADLRPSGRTSRGVKAMNFRDGDVPVDMGVLPKELGEGKIEGHSLLVLTARGYGKRVDTDEFRLTRRGGKGVLALKFKKALDDQLACFRLVSEADEIMLSTFNGIIVRQRAAAISQQSRTATGALVQKLDASDGIKDVALVPEIDDDDLQNSSSAKNASRKDRNPLKGGGGSSGGAAGVTENLRGGGGGEKEDIVRSELDVQSRPAWMSSVISPDKQEALQ